MMGHYYSEMAPETVREFCGWEHPHMAHYEYRKWCVGFDEENARKYKGLRFPGSYSSYGEDYYVCPDCGAMVVNREIHDNFHA
jgi:hypothetical protein